MEGSAETPYESLISETNNGTMEGSVKSPYEFPNTNMCATKPGPTGIQQQFEAFPTDWVSGWLLQSMKNTGSLYDSETCLIFDFESSEGHSQRVSPKARLVRKQRVIHTIIVGE